MKVFEVNLKNICQKAIKPTHYSFAIVVIKMRVKAVLNCLFFFYEKISHTPKALKALNALSDTKTLRQKHKNANKRISNYFPLRWFLGAFFTFIPL